MTRTWVVLLAWFGGVAAGIPWFPCVLAAQSTVEVTNPSFETVKTGGSFPTGWTAEIGGGAKATVEVDDAVRHSGKRSVRIVDHSPTQAFVFASFHSVAIPVKPSTSYVMTFYAKGEKATDCFAAAVFDRGGEKRMFLPSGEFDWGRYACPFTTSEGCTRVTLRFSSDGATGGLWIDDVSLAVAAKQLANLMEKEAPKDYPGFFPRSKGTVARHLVVFDMNRVSPKMGLALAALQGIVNRDNPAIYLINKTNPLYYDEVWLKYMKDKGYTGKEERLSDPKALIQRFRKAITGVIVYDPNLPGSVHAARMLAGIKNALPVSPDLVKELGLPVAMDLRGMWTRNVDAYRYVYDHYWNQMNHRLLAWEYPLNYNNSVADYIVEFKVFCFWVSTYADKEKGADPPAEEEFVNELLAATPGNVPVLGWPMYGDHKGIQEYSGVRWLSEYGKTMPGAEFCSNMSVQSAIHPPDDAFRQKCHSVPCPVKLENDKVYISVNILDSGDALWYWQLYQRGIWADPIRGTLPIGYGMNYSLYDVLPLVAQYYYENATPNDTLFGLIYMNTQVYGNRFRKGDRERIWDEYVHITDEYCRKLDLTGIELYDGGWGDPTPPTPETFNRFIKGVKNLKYILADLGRHKCINPSNADVLEGDTAIFHTLTRYQVWSSTAETQKHKINEANAWLLKEIEANTPKETPAFMSAMAISWYYYPLWLKDLQEKLPSKYVVVRPDDLARLYKESQARKERRKVKVAAP